MSILLICGGKSHEHEISLQSAQFFAKNTTKKLFILTIRKDATCILRNEANKVLSTCEFGLIQIRKFTSSEFICKMKNYAFIFNIVFPILHGPFGEDGTIQGWLETLSISYVGSGVLASAISIDKDISKKLVTSLKIKTPEYITLTRYSLHVPQNIKYPVFVKPANTGSSIGINKVRSQDNLQKSIETAFKYNNKILIEQSIERARDIEIAILEKGDGKLLISKPGEVVVNEHDFYSYKAKYEDCDKVKLLIPAPLTKRQILKLQDMSKQIFRLFNCSGMARIDFLLQDNKIFFNEVNTIPGFTKISLYPNLIKQEGIEYSELIEILLLAANYKQQMSERINYFPD